MCISNKSILNVLSNFIPHETILCDDKNSPWFNSRTKSLLQDKNKIFKNYRKNKTNLQLLNKLNFLQERLNGLITISKNNYYERVANKLNNLQSMLVPIKMFFKQQNNTLNSAIVSWK